MQGTINKESKAQQAQSSKTQQAPIKQNAASAHQAKRSKRTIKPRPRIRLCRS
jgi:hypothetical protein